MSATTADRIKAKAGELGFCKTGIVGAAPLGEERRRLDEWLERGYHGAMAWMERLPEMRADPGLLFPGARSIIVTAHNYYTPHEHPDTADRGKISRYAWGDDYHDVIREKLEQLLEWIRLEIPGSNGRICLDTAPFMDKSWAARAGLGWIGKHTNLITTEVGSWVFIGSIVLDADLVPDEIVVEDHCGTCRRCIDACPTAAIVEPYVLDATRCISYATIELRDETLPRNVEENLSGWIYGCDICQDVCPWNRFQTPTEESRFEPRGGDTSLDLGILEKIDHDTYVERFRQSALKRAKLGGLKRNAAALARGTNQS